MLDSCIVFWVQGRVKECSGVVPGMAVTFGICTEGAMPERGVRRTTARPALRQRVNGIVCGCACCMVALLQ